MAKLKNSSLSKTTKKNTLLGQGSGNSSKTAVPRNSSAKVVSPLSGGAVSQPLKFGTMHTKGGASSTSSGSGWTSLLNSASGGASSAIGGGLLSVGGIGLIGKLFGLFGGGKTPPVAPTQFLSPVSQNVSLSVTTPGEATSISLGSQPVSGQGGYQQIGSTVVNHSAHASQVVQIVKQALLTSSSLNDVISDL